jgi:hypothetical protein
MKKIGDFAKKALHLLLIFSILVSVFSLSSCDRKYDENEVKGALCQLLEKVPTLNTVYYGRGIDYISGSFTDGVYMEASIFHLNSLGFTTVAELKAMTREVFTESYSSEIFSLKLEDSVDEQYLIQQARYYQKVDTDGVTPICIMVDTSAISIFDDRLTYLPDTIKVTGSHKKTVYATVDCIVLSEDGKEQTVSVTVNMIEEKDGWRIDNPIFANYSEK